MTGSKYEGTQEPRFTQYDRVKEFRVKGTEVVVTEATKTEDLERAPLLYRRSSARRPGCGGLDSAQPSHDDIDTGGRSLDALQGIAY
jgi:hypothetical protein